MSEDSMIYVLIAFILGWLVNRMMGNGFSVGGDEQENPKYKCQLELKKNGYTHSQCGGMDDALDEIIYSSGAAIADGVVQPMQPEYAQHLYQRFFSPENGGDIDICSTYCKNNCEMMGNGFSVGGPIENASGPEGYAQGWCANGLMRLNDDGKCRDEYSIVGCINCYNKYIKPDMRDWCKQGLGKVSNMQYACENSQPVTDNISSLGNLKDSVQTDTNNNDTNNNDTNNNDISASNLNRCMPTSDNLNRGTPYIVFDQDEYDKNPDLYDYKSHGGPQQGFCMAFNRGLDIIRNEVNTTNNNTAAKIYDTYYSDNPDICSRYCKMSGNKYCSSQEDI